MLTRLKLGRSEEEDKVSLCAYVVVQLLSCVQLFATPWAAGPGFLVLRHLLEFAQTYVH